MAETKGEKVNRTARIYTVFLSNGHAFSYDAYRRVHPEVKAMENHEILDRIKDDLGHVEFSGETEATSVEEAVPTLRKRKKDLDGLLVFGTPCCVPAVNELISLGLPTVVVARPLEYCTVAPLEACKGEKVVTSHLPAYPEKDSKALSLRFEDLEAKLRVIQAITNMKGLRVLIVTDLPPLGYFEPLDLQCQRGRKEYEEVYLRNLKAIFGTEFVTLPQKRLLSKAAPAQDEQKAREVARKWIEQAVALRGTNESEVFKTAKLYLAMKELMQQNDCDAISIEDFGWPPLGFEASPSACLAVAQLCTDGMVAASETLTDCLLTQQLGLTITGSTGLLGDFTMDPLIDLAIVAHCEGPINPYGDRRMVPYILRNSPFTEENTGGAVIQVHYPIGETVTVAKIGMYSKKIAVSTGETVSGEDLFPYWDDILGRNKVAIRTDARALFENVDWKTFGHHRVVFFGDYRQQFKDLAKLIGYEVVEEDRTR